MSAMIKAVGGFFSFIGKKLYGMYEKNPIVFCIVSGVIVETYIELFSRHSLTSGFKFIFGSPLVFLYNCLIITATLMISLLIRKGIAMYMTVLLVWIAFGTANAIILLVRSTVPFTFSDILILPSVIGILNVYLEIYQIIMIVVAILAAIVALIFLWIKAPKKKIDYKMAVISFLAAAALLGGSTPLGIFTGVLESDYKDMKEGYYDGGFPYSFLRTVFVRSMSEPDEYSRESIEEILAKIEDKKSKDKTAAFDESDAPNIIFVQLESFFDINAVKGVEFSEDPIPTFTKLKSEYPSGFLNVPVLGYGTVQTEFEVLTGMDVDNFPSDYYPLANVLLYKTCDSMAYVLGSKGYSTHALHNNTGTFYGRYKAYSRIGFDTFIPVENMFDIEKNSLDWVKDSILVDEIKYALSSTEGRDLAFAITVQAHGGYNNAVGNGNITVSGVSEESLGAYTYYVNEIHETDKMIKDLTDYYSNYDEKTVIVFYGDHLPDIGLTQDALSRGDMYSTEYIIWSNYGLGNDIKDDHETLEAYQLYPYLFKLLGIKDGLINSAYRYLSNLSYYDNVMKLLEYDTFYGERYAYETYICEKSDIVFGVRQTSISSAELASDGTLTVRGENFNESSVIYVNGKSYDTEFKDGALVCHKVRDADELCIVVKQESESDVVFRETAEYVLKE